MSIRRRVWSVSTFILCVLASSYYIFSTYYDYTSLSRRTAIRSSLFSIRSSETFRIFKSEKRSDLLSSLSTPSIYYSVNNEIEVQADWREEDGTNNIKKMTKNKRRRKTKRDKCKNKGIKCKRKLELEEHEAYVSLDDYPDYTNSVKSPAQQFPQRNNLTKDEILQNWSDFADKGYSVVGEYNMGLCSINFIHTILFSCYII